MRTWLLVGVVLSATAWSGPRWCAALAGPSTRPATATKKAAEPQKLDLGSVSALVPAEWKSQPPVGQFRSAQFVVPRATGDTAETLFIVFHFGKGGGGTVEDNITRWIGMMRAPDGGDARGRAKRGTVERDGLKITTLDIAGTYLERPFPMSPQATPRANYRMLAAIVETLKETGDGPYYVRLVGPARSVTAAKAGWDAFVASLRAR